MNEENTYSNNDLEVFPKLSKNYILNRITQEDIFERYLGVSVVYDKLICNPLRNDNNPTCGFKWSGNKLRFKDFAGYFWGDCFDLVAFIYGLNPNNTIDFIKVLEIIAKDFKLHKFSNLSPNEEESIVANQKAITLKEKSADVVIKVVPRNYVYEDTLFWDSYKVLSCSIVSNKYFCFPVQEAYVDGRKIYNYGGFKTDVCYAYFFGYKPNGQEIWKLYFPRRKKGRFIMNLPVIEGMNQANHYTDITVISKAYKDCMCINEIAQRYNISVKAVGLPSESHFPAPETIEVLREKSEIIVSLLDFDFTGRNTAWKLTSIYKIRPLFMTNGKWNTINYGSKDYSDYLVTNSLEQSINLFHKSYSYIMKNKHKYVA